MLIEKNYIITKEELGKIGEGAVKSALDTLEVKYSKNAINYRGADFALVDILIEVKNFSGKYCLSPYTVNNEIISRFIDSDPNHKTKWILVISKLKASESSRLLLNHHGVKIIEWGKQLRSNSRRAIRKVSNNVSSQLKNLFKISKKDTGVFSLSKLNNIISSIFIGKDSTSISYCDKTPYLSDIVLLNADPPPDKNTNIVLNATINKNLIRNQFWRYRNRILLTGKSIIKKWVGDTKGVNHSIKRRVF